MTEAAAASASTSATASGTGTVMSAEAVKAAVEAAMLAENMSLAEASGDKGVRLGEAGWRDRYYANKLGPEVRKKLDCL